MLQKIRRAFSCIPLQVVLCGATLVVVMLPFLLGGVLLNTMQHKLVLDTYAESLANSFSTIGKLMLPPERLQSALEQQLGHTVKHYSFSLYLLEGGQPHFVSDYNMNQTQGNSLPIATTVCQTMQQQGVQATLHSDLYRGELLYIATPLQDGLSVVGIFPIKQFQGASRRFTAVILMMLLLTVLLLVGLWVLLGFCVVRPINRLLYSIRNPSLQPIYATYLDWNNELGRLCIAYQNRVQEFDENLRRVDVQNEKKRKSELEALQNQINSHFIYNTLNNIQWLASGGRTDDVIATVKALDCLLRACAHSEKDMVTLEEELSYVEAYLTAQRIRFGDVFDYSFEVDVLLLQMKIPKFILQPIVENSIYHGFVNGNKTNGTIKISVVRRGHRIDVKVFDDGVGIEKERMNAVLRNRYKSSGRYMGVALGNVNKRIKLLCGREYGLGIKSKFGQYTVAEITIPMIP